MSYIDLTGNKYGRLTVISFSHMDHSSCWNVKCDCGKEFVIKGNAMKSGNTKSCGCLMSERSPFVKTSTYAIWSAMKTRCLNPNIENYKHYGGRGITFCDRWKKFKNFLEDMGERPAGLSIDRIDVNGNYCKENCRWATNKEQQNNKRNSKPKAMIYPKRLANKNRLIEFNGERKTVSQWAEKLNIKHNTLYHRLFRVKWSIEKSLTEPLHKEHSVRGCSNG